MRYKYCPNCGGLLEERLIEEEIKLRLICKDCDFIFYINPTPAVAVILFNNDGEILLVKRKYEPRRNYWALPAGFLEYDETVEETAIREIKEETNLDIKLNGLFGVYSAFDDPRVQVLLVVYRGEIIDGDLKPGDDAEEVSYFSFNNLPKNIAFKCHYKILKMLRQEKEGSSK